MSNLTYLKIFLDWTEATEMLKDAEKGRLVDALVLYARGQDADAYSRLSGNEAFLFPMFKLQVDRDAADIAKISHTNSENGRKGGRPKKTEKTDRFFENRTVFSETEKSQDKDKDKDKDKEYIEPSNDGTCFAPVVDRWNALPAGIARINGIVKGSTRDTMLSKRIRDYSLDSVLQAIDNIRQSQFLQGENDNGWVITFDWFIKPVNFQKVLEGNYTDRKQKRNDNDRVRDELAEWMEEVTI